MIKDANACSLQRCAALHAVTADHCKHLLFLSASYFPHSVFVWIYTVSGWFRTNCTPKCNNLDYSLQKTNTGVTQTTVYFNWVSGREEKKKLCLKLFVSFSCQLISGSVGFLTADFHFITMIALRESLKGCQCCWNIHTHTHINTCTHIPDSPISLRASRCLHGQSTSSNQLKTALSSWSMAEVGVGQDEDSRRGGVLFRKIRSKTQWEYFLFGVYI